MPLRPVGRRALLLESDDPDRAADVVRGWYEAVTALVDEGSMPAPVEMVPGARTLLLDGVDVGAVSRLLDRLPGPDEARPGDDGPLVTVPVVYDGADLHAVARAWGVGPEEVVERHTATEFRVSFCGFAPGFPYLVGWDDEVPRRATPRAVVPAGSVGLAGRYCGIYPTASPGGWQLLGTTDVQLFSAGRDEPALLPPGTRVRFVRSADGPRMAPAEPRPTLRVASERGLTVVRAGALTTVQDAGRRGLAHLGVPRGGALDADAACLANRLVGNPEDAAVLETTVTGIALRARTSVTVAVTGAVASVTVQGRPVGWGVAVHVGAGQVIDVGPASSGVRSYVAVSGGIDVPPVLGSRSTDTLSGLGPERLADGDELCTGAPAGRPAGVDFTVPRQTGGLVELRLRPGPRADWFGDAGLQALLAATYEVSNTSNRVGARLSGPPVPRAVDSELESEGMVLGAVQVPPDGQPVVLLADHPTTGGYPVIGVVEPDDLGVLAQCAPGAGVRFVLDRRQ